MTTFEERRRQHLMNPNAVASALKWALDRYPLTVTARQTTPVSWVCRTCWAETDVTPASVVAFPHKPDCKYHGAVKVYVAMAREAGWQNDAPPTGVPVATEVAP